jgi:hypothetical protein
MAISPSNSGVLRCVGDAVVLERDPAHDCVGVQLYGDGDGVELLFEGSVMGAGLCPIECGAEAEAMPLTANGRFACLVPASGINHFRVKLAAITSGCVNVALYSGTADKMKIVAVPAPAPDKKPVPTKVARGKTAPPTGFRVHEDNAQFFVIDNVTGRSSEPFKTRIEADKWLVAQPVQAVAWTGPYTVKQDGANFFVIDAGNHPSAPFKSKAEADQWVASHPKPAPAPVK